MNAWARPGTRRRLWRTLGGLGLGAAPARSVFLPQSLAALARLGRGPRLAAGVPGAAFGASSSEPAVAAARGTSTVGPEVPLRVVLPHAPTTLDPHRAFLPADRAVARQLYEPLLRFGPAAEPAAGAAIGAVPGEGATRWTFTLRPDARWSDGSALEPETYVQGWLRVMSRDVPDDLFALFRPVAAAGLYRVGLVDAEAIGLRATSPATFEVRLEAPAAHLPHVAALWLSAPLHPLAAEGARGASGAGAPVGNGPFVLQGWDDGGTVSLQPNPHYWRGAPPGPLRFLAGRRAIDDALTDLAGSRAGLAPATLADVVPVPEELAAEVLADPRLRDLLVRQPRLATVWLTCNVTRPPLDNPLLRKALAYAVDRRRYVAEVLGGAGLPAFSLLPLGAVGHDPQAGAAYDLRPDAARALLAAAGLEPEALRLTVTVPATAAGRRGAAFLQHELARHLGLSLGISELDRYSYVRAFEHRHFELAFGGWEGPYPDPEGWFWLPFGAGKAGNRTGWESRAMDALWRQGDETIDPGRRLDLYAAAQQIVLDEMPVVFLAQLERLAVVHPRVRGLIPAPMDEFPGVDALATVRLTP